MVAKCLTILKMRYTVSRSLQNILEIVRHLLKPLRLKFELFLLIRARLLRRSFLFIFLLTSFHLWYFCSKFWLCQMINNLIIVYRYVDNLFSAFLRNARENYDYTTYEDHQKLRDSFILSLFSRVFSVLLSHNMESLIGLHPLSLERRLSAGETNQ